MLKKKIFNHLDNSSSQQEQEEHWPEVRAWTNPTPFHFGKDTFLRFNRGNVTTIVNVFKLEKGFLKLLFDSQRLQK